MKVKIGGYLLESVFEGWKVTKKNVVREGKNKGKISWVNPKYYPRLDMAIYNTYDRMLRETEVEEHLEFEELQDHMSRCKEDISRALTNLGELSVAYLAKYNRS